MLKKLSYFSAEDEKSKLLEKARSARHAHFNYAPKGFRSISEEEFAKSAFFSYIFVLCETRQLMCTYEGEPLGKTIWCQLYYLTDGTGFGIESSYWDAKVNYYAFGCQHQYKELNKEETKARGLKHYGMCWHVQECQVCGHITSYDSSD